MRKEYGKVLREHFACLMKEKLPEFKETKYPDNSYVGPGERIYCRVRENAHHFIILVPDPKGREDFTIELGWSKLGRFPPIGRPTLGDFPTLQRDEFKRDEFFLRLDQFWSKKGYWWSIEPEADYLNGDVLEFVQQNMKAISMKDAQKKVIPVVDQAFSKLLEHGVPYLKEFFSFTVN